jgi:prolycopene isomerase
MKKDEYDVIIIGAGIGGLVCGCYLAKAGLKTLIVEKNAKPGGYCTSFKRKGVNFDACVHVLSSLRKRGRLNKFCEELGIETRNKFKVHDPSDIVVTPEFKINFFHDLDKTIQEFQKYFPNQKKEIDIFFRFMAFSPISLILQQRSKTFEEMLSGYFTDSRLKTILSVLILSLAGLPATEVSAFVGCFIYREFLFDGGYYPIGGIQSFSDLLANRFEALGGIIILSTLVKKISIANGKADGVILADGKLISSKYVVSACDARQTFFEFTNGEVSLERIKNKINIFLPSLSVFSLYLGITKNLNEIPELKANVWVIATYDIQKIYHSLINCQNEHFAITSSSAKDRSLLINDTESICLCTNVPFKDTSYWDGAAKELLADRLIRMSKVFIPELEKHIILKIIATPITLYKWTYNYRGAAYGWASTPKQFGDPDLSQKTPLDNLFLTGHWTNQSSGITSVANCGYDTAILILREEGKL